MVRLSPFVYWAQTADIITLKIDLKDVNEHFLDLSEENIKFSANGTGAHGRNDYCFEINLYSKIDPENDSPECKVFDSKVELVLKKEKSGWWPRLTAQPQKPVWLKVDFDRWKVDSTMMDASDEDRCDIMKAYPNAYDNLHKHEMGYRKEDLKKVYLAFYNTFQFVGFSYVTAVMGMRYSKLGPESIPTTYENVGNALKFMHLLMILEVMHPMFGYTRGGVLQPFIQVFGRIAVLFVFLDAEPRMQIKPVVFYLFLAWSLIEVVRYPYYVSQLYKLNLPFLTWLRYSLWIPLFPIGLICECVIILRNIPYFEETGRYSMSLPNEWNFSFHLPSLMRIYLLFLSIPVAYTLMSHMYRARVNKLRRYRRITKCS